jgi:hypothetical protein
VALHPDLVVRDIYGNPMNIALVIAVFAELSRALNIPMRFPCTDKAYGQLLQFTGAGLRAWASVWAALSESVARLSMWPAATFAFGGVCGKTRPNI